MARRRRKRNISATWVVVASAAVLVTGAGITYAIVKRRKKLPERPTPPRPCPPGHVGDPAYAWPRDDLFLDETGFGEALEAFGYDVGEWTQPGWYVCDDVVRTAISEFQTDYNLVRRTIDQPVTDVLDVTGMINDDTVLAMAYVDSLRQAGLEWPLIVEETRGAGL